MRLLHTKSFELKEFAENQIPAYAILSHTWGSDEVLLNDIRNKTYMKKDGFKKIKHACFQATKQDYEYIWVDTCCIDKSSSAELSEAINSMYRWYQQARICYAYLDDVEPTEDERNYPSDALRQQLQKSRWFQRGWTLQELIAPRSVMFFSHLWNHIGTKISLLDPLSKITGIDNTILSQKRGLESASVAKRMSWAASREVSRNEDIAYCLMGIFNINMPLLYGEGGKAFIRLQEEIMKQSDDQSLFAWHESESSGETLHGLLAKSPKDFLKSTSIVPYAYSISRIPYSMSNKGLHIELPLTVLDDQTKTYTAALACTATEDYKNNYYGISLKRLPDGDRQYARVNANADFSVAVPGPLQEIYVRNTRDSLGVQKFYPHHLLQLRNGPKGLHKTTAGHEVHRLVSKKVGKFGRFLKPTDPNRAACEWVPPQFPCVFIMSKKPRSLIIVLFFKLGTEQRLVTISLRVGFEGAKSDVCFSVSARYDHSEQSVRGYEHTMGSLAFIDGKTVRVNAETEVKGDTKYYLIDIDIDPTVVESPDNSMTSDPVRTPSNDKSKSAQNLENTVNDE